MNNEDFNRCREFLEKLIVQDGINENALNVYAKLIELKSVHDKEIEKSVIEKEIRESESYDKYLTSRHRNNTDYDIARDNNRTSDYSEEHQTFRGLDSERSNNLLNRDRR